MHGAPETWTGADPGFDLPCRTSAQTVALDAVHVALAADWQDAGWAAAQVWRDGLPMAAESMGRLSQRDPASDLAACDEQLDVLDSQGRPVWATVNDPTRLPGAGSVGAAHDAVGLSRSVRAVGPGSESAGCVVDAARASDPSPLTSTCGRGLRRVLWPARGVHARAGPSRGRRDQSGTVSLELVLLVPVLVLLTVFVLWAGRGGRAALTADLAAEEAATAAALCCEEGKGAGEAGREALVEDMLDARPGLGFLCIGGPRPDVPPDEGSGPDEFVKEDWLEFDASRDTGGVGVLGVRFLCESDGAVAPLRGLFPTVTFHGQAAEVVQRDPLPVGVRFDPTPVRAVEGTDLVFTVTIDRALTEDLDVTLQLRASRRKDLTAS